MLILSGVIAETFTVFFFFCCVHIKHLKYDQNHTNTSTINSMGSFSWIPSTLWNDFCIEPYVIYTGTTVHVDSSNHFFSLLILSLHNKTIRYPVSIETLPVRRIHKHTICAAIQRKISYKSGAWHFPMIANSLYAPFAKIYTNIFSAIASIVNI